MLQCTEHNTEQQSAHTISSIAVATVSTGHTSHSMQCIWSENMCARWKCTRDSYTAIISSLTTHSPKQSMRCVWDVFECFEQILRKVLLKKSLAASQKIDLPWNRMNDRHASKLYPSVGIFQGHSKVSLYQIFPISSRFFEHFFFVHTQHSLLTFSFFRINFIRIVLNCSGFKLIESIMRNETKNIKSH